MNRIGESIKKTKKKMGGIARFFCNKKCTSNKIFQEIALRHYRSSECKQIREMREMMLDNKKYAPFRESLETIKKNKYPKGQLDSLKQTMKSQEISEAEIDIFLNHSCYNKGFTLPEFKAWVKQQQKKNKQIEQQKAKKERRKK